MSRVAWKWRSRIEVSFQGKGDVEVVQTGKQASKQASQPADQAGKQASKVVWCVVVVLVLMMMVVSRYLYSDSLRSRALSLSRGPAVAAEAAAAHAGGREVVG